MPDSAPGTDRPEAQLFASRRRGNGFFLQHPVDSGPDGDGLATSAAALEVRSQAGWGVVGGTGIALERKAETMVVDWR